MLTKVHNPLYMGHPLTGTFKKVQDPDEMQHNAAFHLSLHCLLRLKSIQAQIENYTSDHLKCTIRSPILIHVSIIWESPSEYKGLTLAFSFTRD